MKNHNGSHPDSESHTKQKGSNTETPPKTVQMPKGPGEKIVPSLIDETPRPEHETGTVIIKKGILKSPSIDKYSLRCTVNLFRDDLLKIKDVFSKNTEGTVSPKNFSPVGFQCNINEKLNPNNYVPDTSKPKKNVSFSDIVTIIEIKEYNRCKKCPRVYYTRKALKSHMKKVHKKKQAYICGFCDKKFMDRMFFKVHMKLHCDVCGLLLPSRAKCLEHRRTTCRTLHKCSNCDCIFFRQKDLRDHNYDHVDTCFVCDTCKDKLDSKCAVAHHIRFLHSKRRPKAMYTIEKFATERLFSCNFCDVSNINKDLIEEHQISLPDLSNRIMKGTREYYFCDQCKKKFKKEKQLTDHKWSHFLNSNDKSHTSLKGAKDNAPHNFNTQFEGQRKNYVTHTVKLNNGEDYSNDSLTTEKSVSPINVEKENINQNGCSGNVTAGLPSKQIHSAISTFTSPVLNENNNNSNPKDIFSASLFDLLTSKSEPPLLLSESKNKNTIQKYYKINDVPQIMLKPRVFLKRCKINGKEVTKKMSIIDLKTHKISKSKVTNMIVTEPSSTNDLDMIMSKTLVTNDINMIVSKTTVTNDVDIPVTNTVNDNPEIVVKTPKTHDEGNQDVTDTDKTTIPLLKTANDQNTPLLEQVLLHSATSTSPISNESDAQPSAEKRPRKTLYSKHQCSTCGQYYSSGYCLRRHINTQHYDLESLQCKDCEETFVWPSLLFSHKCIRLNHREMPFQDARPEIHFDNVQPTNNKGIDGMNIRDSDSLVAEPLQGGILDGRNEPGKNTMLTQMLSKPSFQPNGFSQTTHVQPNRFSQIPDSVDEFAHLPIVTNPGVISQGQRPFDLPLLPQTARTNSAQTALGQASEQGFTMQLNSLNRPVLTVTRLNQCTSNGTQQNHVMNMMQQGQFIPSATMQQNNQKKPVSSLNSNLNRNLPIEQLESMGYKLVMEEVPIEF